MFKKILIVEDQQSIGKGLQTILKDLTQGKVQTTSYCDDAYIKIKSAINTNAAFDLLITDLSFQKDYFQTKITSGEKLVARVKELQPDLKIIVFSVESGVAKVKKLINEYSVDAFVSKGRREAEEIEKAMNAVYEDKTYYSESIKKLLNNTKNISELTSTDTLILELLANGLKQNKLPKYFKDNNIPSGSKRSIEYRIEHLKIVLNADTVPHLISIAKDIGLI